MKGRYTVQITRADVGRRVTIRHRLPASLVEPGGPTTTDVVGTLRSWGDGVLVIERDDGTSTRVAEGDVLAARARPR